MEFNEIVNGYVKASSRYYEKRLELEETIARAESKLREIKDKAPNWVDNLVKPLAKEIKKRLGMKAYDIYGPFGLDCEVSIYFSNQGKIGNIPITKVDTLKLTIYPQIRNTEFDLVCADKKTLLPRTIDEIMKLLVKSEH